MARRGRSATASVPETDVEALFTASHRVFNYNYPPRHIQVRKNNTGGWTVHGTNDGDDVVNFYARTKRWKWERYPDALPTAWQAALVDPIRRSLGTMLRKGEKEGSIEVGGYAINS